MSRRAEDLARIEAAMAAARTALRPFQPGEVASILKAGGDPVTEADHAVNRVLEESLPRPGEGWLSEETADDHRRLSCRRVWVVDPVDGTREFIEGIPEWCVSIGLVEDGAAVAGGICNPATGELFLGSAGGTLRYNGAPVSASSSSSLAGGTVLASRSEARRGEWTRFADLGFTIRPMGSVAYKLARVAAGLDTATWTLVPKNEWDLAAGTALGRAGGAVVRRLDGSEPRFNGADPLFDGLVACAPGVAAEVLAMLDIPGS